MSEVPVLIAVPHAGRSYPEAAVALLREPERAALRLEDRLVDSLARAVAVETGASLIIAHAPRALIDLNRSPDDVDWEMIDMAGKGRPGKSATSRRTRGGLGLIPRRVPGMGEIWRGPTRREELRERIDSIHRPYHDAVQLELASIRERWGAALLLDLHSMPPLDQGGGPPIEFVIGDRFGASCEGGLMGSAFAHFALAGVRTAHNRPYAGGYGLDRHCVPRRGVHGLQLEIDRRSYLDAQLREPGPGMDRAAELVCGLLRRLAGEVALLGARLQWREAAE